MSKQVGYGAHRLVGTIFWSLAGTCSVLIPLGILSGQNAFVPAGMVGTGWFMMLACLPREWFLKRA